jgi:beta-1,4-mannosyl-glycoprotein beta-1,4-N-acetylglucosaminyltransferase|tara:strand:- start:2073 stop:2945 length:873 start_codon:yes stop_codon:yes gene_type:complete
MFFDEEMLLDLRLNMMNKHVDKFVITESTKMHSGKSKKLLFDINKFSQFKDKINYIVVDNPPANIIKINQDDSLDVQQSKMIINAKAREMEQINKTQDGIVDADPNDIIIVSDLDEIPNLEKINFNEVNQKLIFFKQKMFYYKLNLFYKDLPWYGSKACKKKYFKNPEWLRSIKNKKYPYWRFDTIFSDIKYNDIHFVNDGGWHFTNMKGPEELEKKLLNFLHHVDYEQSGLNLNDLKRLMKEKKIMYNHSVDKKNNKWGNGENLEPLALNDMPDYIKKNFSKYKNWLDN